MSHARRDPRALAAHWWECAPAEAALREPVIVGDGVAAEFYSARACAKLFFLMGLGDIYVQRAVRDVITVTAEEPRLGIRISPRSIRRV